MTAHVYKFAKMPLDTARYETEIQGFITDAGGTLVSLDIVEMGAQFIVTIITS